jgi:hypothetical protein
MFPWFSSLIDEANKTSQQRTSVEDEINNPETPSTRRTSDHDVFAFEKLGKDLFPQCKIGLAYYLFNNV